MKKIASITMAAVLWVGGMQASYANVCSDNPKYNMHRKSADPGPPGPELVKNYFGPTAMADCQAQYAQSNKVVLQRYYACKTAPEGCYVKKFFYATTCQENNVPVRHVTFTAAALACDKAFRLNGGSSLEV